MTRRFVVRALLVLALTLATLAPTVGAAPDITVGEKTERKGWSWTWIDERGLALGGGGLKPDDVEHLREHGFGAVVNFRAEFPQEEADVRAAGMEYLFVNTTHAEEDIISIAELDENVAFIESNLAAGRPVYVHCTAGWHRSAAGVIAYYMKHNGWRYQEAYDHVASRRPGIEPRFEGSLLLYEAHLFGGPNLMLDIWTPRWDVAPNETLPVHALVTHNGVPIEGAAVELVSESSRNTTRGTTGPDGRVDLRYTARPTRGQEFVHATARLDGFIDGYDRNVYWINEPKTRLPTVIAPLPDTLRAEAGEEVALDIAIAESDGDPTNARVTLTTPCATFHRDYTGWDGRARATFRAPTQNGTYPLLVHVTRFPAEPVNSTILLVVGDGGPMPACEPKEKPPVLASEIAPSSPEVATIAGTSGSRWSPAWIVGAVSGVVVAVAALLLKPLRGRRG